MTGGESTVLSSKMSGGPRGLGDPDDTSLRRVETEVLIPKIIRNLTRTEKCAEEVGQFNNCVKKWPFLMVINCRKENNVMKQCQEHWYYNEEFREHCKQIYLKDRSEYRKTGISKTQRDVNVNTQPNIN